MNIKALLQWNGPQIDSYQRWYFYNKPFDDKSYLTLS